MSRCHRFFTLQRIKDWDSLRPDRVHSYRFESLKSRLVAQKRWKRMEKSIFLKFCVCSATRKVVGITASILPKENTFPQKWILLKEFLFSCKIFCQENPYRKSKYFTSFYFSWDPISHTTFPITKQSLSQNERLRCDCFLHSKFR